MESPYCEIEYRLRQAIYEAKKLKDKDDTCKEIFESLEAVMKKIENAYDALVEKKKKALKARPLYTIRYSIFETGSDCYLTVHAHSEEEAIKIGSKNKDVKEWLKSPLKRGFTVYTKAYLTTDLDTKEWDFEEYEKDPRL